MKRPVKGKAKRDSTRDLFVELREGRKVSQKRGTEIELSELMR